VQTRLQQGDRCGVPEIGGASVLASRSRLSRNTGGQMGSLGLATVSASGSFAFRKTAKSDRIKPDQTSFMQVNRSTPPQVGGARHSVRAGGGQGTARPTQFLRNPTESNRIKPLFMLLTPLSLDRAAVRADCFQPREYRQPYWSATGVEKTSRGKAQLCSTDDFDLAGWRGKPCLPFRTPHSEFRTHLGRLQKPNYQTNPIFLA